MCVPRAPAAAQTQPQRLRTVPAPAAGQSQSLRALPEPPPFSHPPFLSPLPPPVASRNIFARASLDAPKGENMTPENLYGVLTIIALLISIPAALLVEGPKIAVALQAASMSVPELAKAVTKTGAYFYLYNEVAMLALNNVHPVTHAVANTIKRVVILLACLIVFRNPITPLCAVGSAVAIGGSYVYSMAKQRERAHED